jgi:WD40 repeat protein
VWNITTAKLIRRFKQLHYIVTHVTPDGSTAVSASGHTIVVWDIVTGTVIHTLQKHNGPVIGTVLTSDGKTAISASGDKTLIVWDIHTEPEFWIAKRTKQALWSPETTS